ncbi:hypothetical protein [Treponema porcinum]|uniref:hypothetical protein n=1 Tax=Treponema porcinum TaxID=261392 RepID=UPI0023535FD5|nr:hypothetical protein [Treponema porcinum]MCI6480951.1 hypothetical protein [Treponema porcinum]
MRKKIKINLAAKKRFTVIFLTFIMLTVLSCNFSDDLDDSKHSGGQEKYVTVCGTFALQGAVPSSLRSKPGTRSAVPSLPEGISCAVTATSAKNETATASYISSDGQFEIKLTQGEWTVSAEIKKDGKTILSGDSDKISITAAKPIEDKIIIILKPDSSSGSGTVNLPVTIENTSGIKSAQVSWTGSSSGITGNQTLDFSSNTSAAFTMGGTDISSGAYTAVFQFYSEESDRTKRLLFQCTETINVCANLCTDSWVKNGTNSSAWLKENDGTTSFTITDTLVKNFAQVSFFVQGTGGTYTPKTQANDTNNGTYFDPLSTVQAAVDKIVQINDGLTEYFIFIDGTVTAPDSLDSSITPNFVKIDPQKTLKLTISSLSSDLAVINANKKAGVMYVLGKNADEKTTLVLQNICLTGGKTQSDGVGGGLKAEYSEITLKSGTVIGTKLLPDENGSSDIATSSNYGNFAAKGGGIYINGCTLTIENGAYICQNYSKNEGGGIAAEGSSNIISNGGIIGFNLASSGGGIYIKDGSAELTDCTVSLNKANSNGGGIYIDGSSLTLNGGTVVGDKNATQTATNLVNKYSNYASSYGGGIYAINTNITMNDDSCVMYNIALYNSGGGLYVENGSLAIKNAKINYNYSTIQNSGTGSGGGLKLAGNASMTIKSDSEIAYNASAFTGAGIELTGTSSCTMNSGSIHDNKNNAYSAERGLGAGVCIASGTTFTMNGGKIYGNMYKNQILHKFGDAIYVAGTLNLSADACIAPDNDVYLASGTFVTLTGKLTGESPVATLTPESYDDSRTMLKSGGSYTLIQDDCDKFAVTKDSANNKFYRVSFDTSSNYGILKESKLTAKAELSGIKFIPSTSAIYFSKVQAGGQKISFSVQKKTADGTGITYTKVTPSSAKIALYQNGSELTNHSVEASNNLPELTLASWLPEGKYNLYMSATVDGVEYSAWETFVITSKIPISSLTSAPDSNYYPHLAAETGEDLKKLNEWMQGGSTMEGITITLTKDIDLTSETEWQPIGENTTEVDTYTGVPFKGTINGNGNTIKLEISSEAQTCLGLVKINEGIIENLIIEQYSQDGITFGDSSARGSRGGAICVINRGIIRNCVNKANLIAYTFWGVAGICMVNYGTVENCLNTGDIEMVNSELWEGEWIYSSGIAAQNVGSIINCVNTGKIIAQELQCTSTYVNNFSGAIAGRLYNTEDTSADISNCYWLKNSVTRNGTDVNECVTIVEHDITYYVGDIHVDSIPDPSKITGCGYFNDFSASAPLTAGDEASCKTDQTLFYGTTLLEALNGYVSANPDRELKQWKANADGSLTIGF